MNASLSPLDPTRLRAFPLASRESLSSIDEILVDPDEPPPPCPAPIAAQVEACAVRMKAAKKAGAGIMLIYGAHLIKNGGQRLVQRLVEHGWLTHLATNGAGTIHDWEFAWLGRSTESVRANVATGTFGAWEETGRFIHLALLAGGLHGEGYGRALGRFIAEDGVDLPSVDELEDLLRAEPSHALTPARADLLLAMKRHGLAPGRHDVSHRWKPSSVLAHAYDHGVPLTVHPGIGYDIIATHPMFDGAAIGRAAQVDFYVFAGAVDTLDAGVVLSIGSAIMGPQVFEKALSCVNNVRRTDGRNIVRDLRIFVVDLQDGGGWDWSAGEPPKDNPAYYLRFCKSYSRMGGGMQYVQCDNILFLHNLVAALG